MRLKIWGCRGSVPTPGPETVHYGGNTSCVEVSLDDGAVLVLDAGTGIIQLGLELLERGVRRVHLLLTHLHLDHLEGLRFFAPLWDERVALDIWGPPSPLLSLRERISRSFSPPLFPIAGRPSASGSRTAGRASRTCPITSRRSRARSRGGRGTGSQARRSPTTSTFSSTTRSTSRRNTSSESGGATRVSRTQSRSRTRSAPGGSCSSITSRAIATARWPASRSAPSPSQAGTEWSRRWRAKA